MAYTRPKVWLVQLGMVFAACGGTAATTSTLPPPTSLTTTTAPSTTAPPDPAEVFKNTILDAGFAAAAVIKGQVTVGDREVVVSGSAAFLPEGSWQIFEVAGAEPEETLMIGADKWVRKGEGPWVT